jgi:hypothetical protein
LDAVSWLEYGRLGDHPACVCPVFAAFGRDINDAMSDAGRQRLKLFIPRLVGTVDPAHEQERAEYLAWQAIRVFVPLALEAVGQHKHAAILRGFTGSLVEAAWAASAAGRAAEATGSAAGWAAEAAGWAASAARAAAKVEKAEKAARATWLATSAARAAKAADWVAWEAVKVEKAARARAAGAEDAMIAAFEGVLAIGRQAEIIEPARFDAAIKLFEEVRSR